jgi:hypothetical protein
VKDQPQKDPMTKFSPPAGPPDPYPSFLAVAVRRDIVRRALGYGIVVGAILITINYADVMLAGEISARDLSKMLLTICVPYCVSTASSVGAIRSALR